MKETGAAVVGGLFGEGREMFSDVYKKGSDGKMQVQISNPVEYFSSLLHLQGQGEADVKIVCQDGTVLTAHKAILATRSSYLQSVLSSTSDQRDLQQVLVLAETKPNLVRKALSLLYTGWCYSSKSELNEIAVFLRNLEINDVHEVDPTEVVQKSKSLALSCDPPSRNRPSGEVEEVFVAGPSSSWEHSSSDPYKMPAALETKPPPGHVLRSTNSLVFCQSLITRIMKLKEAAPFRGPVDPIRQRAPNYYNVIKKPMDLGTIYRRIQNKYYWKADECVQDFKQMIANCKVFNNQGDLVVMWAEVIEKEFLKNIKNMPEEEEMSKETLMYLTPESAEAAEALVKESHEKKKKRTVSSLSAKSSIKCPHCPREFKSQIGFQVHVASLHFKLDVGEAIRNVLGAHGNKCPKCPGKHWEPDLAGRNRSAKQFTKIFSHFSRAHHLTANLEYNHGRLSQGNVKLIELQLE